MRKSLIAGIVAGLIAALPALAAEQTVSITVGDMTCPSCSFTVAMSMRHVPTVKIIDFQESETFGEGIFVVSFDDETASPEMIIASVMANGYPAEILPNEILPAE